MIMMKRPCMTSNIKDDTPLVLSAATFEGEKAKGSPKAVDRMREQQRGKLERARPMRVPDRER